MTTKDTFTLWAMGCSHAGTDLEVGQRHSLAEAIQQAENSGDEGGPAFAWDIVLNLGDLSDSQTAPDDDEGREVVRQLGASTLHPREHFYHIIGNHDASAPDKPCQWWFRKWLDPEGLNPEFSGVHADRRLYPIEGTWERYAFRVGNMLILMMSDRNDGGPPVGRAARGGYPAGAVTGETFAWWKEAVEANQDAVILTAHQPTTTCCAKQPWPRARGRVLSKAKTASGNPTTTATFPTAAPKALLTSTLSTASPTPRPLKAIWPTTPAPSTCGWTPTPTPTTAKAAAPTSNKNGAPPSSTSPPSRATTPPSPPSP